MLLSKIEKPEEKKKRERDVQPHCKQLPNNGSLAFLECGHKTVFLLMGFETFLESQGDPSNQRTLHFDRRERESVHGWETAQNKFCLWMQEHYFRICGSDNVDTQNQELQILRKPYLFKLRRICSYSWLVAADTGEKRIESDFRRMIGTPKTSDFFK